MLHCSQQPREWDPGVHEELPTEGLWAFLEHRGKMQLLLALVKIYSHGLSCSPWRDLLPLSGCLCPIAASSPDVGVA